MLWTKALHIVFVTSWFAGLFYLPRIFVNVALIPADSPAERARLLLMARKLYRFTTLLAFPALVLGLVLWLYYGMGKSAAGVAAGWLVAKLLVVGLTIAYHYNCGRLLKKLETNQASHSHIWYRWYNEVPVILLITAVILVVVKPF